MLDEAEGGGVREAKLPVDKQGRWGTTIFYFANTQYHEQAMREPNLYMSSEGVKR